MTELTEILQQQTPVTPDQADRITALWPGLLTSRISSEDEYYEINQAIRPLSEPTDPEWIMARVAALLTQYYAADVPTSVVAMMAEDWLEELKNYPQWALTKAVRWWKSSDNPDRKRKPFEGDIAERARIEFGVIHVGAKAVRDYERYGPAVALPERVSKNDLTPEERAGMRARADGIVASAGIKLRRSIPTHPSDQWAAE